MTVYRKRRQPGISATENSLDLGPPPPMDEKEMNDGMECWESRPAEAASFRSGGMSFLKRTFGILLAVGFSLLGIYLFSHLIQAIYAILVWPPWVSLPLLSLLGLLLLYIVLRLLKLWFAIRKLPKLQRLDRCSIERMNARQRDALRASLVPQLKHILKLRSGRSEGLVNQVEQLLASVAYTPSDAWLETYRGEVLSELGQNAGEVVWRIATVAGVSAALSPWKLLDAFIAFNAAVEVAGKVLRIYGFQPDAAMAVAFAFDTFVSTFFAAAFEEIAEDIAQDAAERISSELGAKATQVLAPKMAQGLAITFFVRRLGRRMIRRMTPR